VRWSLVWSWFAGLSINEVQPWQPGGNDTMTLVGHRQGEWPRRISRLSDALPAESVNQDAPVAPLFAAMAAEIHHRLSPLARLIAASLRIGS